MIRGVSTLKPARRGLHLELCVGRSARGRDDDRRAAKNLMFAHVSVLTTSDHTPLKQRDSSHLRV